MSTEDQNSLLQIVERNGFADTVEWLAGIAGCKRLACADRPKDARHWQMVQAWLSAAADRAILAPKTERQEGRGDAATG